LIVPKETGEAIPARSAYSTSSVLCTSSAATAAPLRLRHAELAAQREIRWADESHDS
jgi:hypothetical protein